MKLVGCIGTGEKLEALPYYKWYWQRFRASRTTQRMGYIARGLYRELLDEQWVKGGIPDDLEQLAHVCDCPLEVMQAEWPKIARCFSIKRKGLLMNGTLESMRTETDTKRTKRVLSGSKGGVRKAIGISAGVAGAKQLPEASKRVLANAGICHIGEERRVEKRRVKKPSAQSVEPAEQKPSRRQAASEMKHSTDPRHIACKDAIFAYYRDKNSGEDPDWAGREGMALGMLLQANPRLTAEGMSRLLTHRARSDVNHSERPGVWVPRMTSYRNGPLDRWGKPQTGESNGKPSRAQAELDAALRELEDDHAATAGHGADAGRDDEQGFSPPLRFAVGS